MLRPSTRVKFSFLMYQQMITMHMDSDDHRSGTDRLLDLDGQVLFVDPEGACWVKFVVKRCEISAGRPHGLSYSLTLHDADGKRLLGFDNAHAIGLRSGPARKMSGTFDHWHRNEKVLPYDFQSAGQLLDDFWTAVDAHLTEQGKQP